jgi:hypothetical protein
MRVKIAYTVEIEEVETEVQEIISKGLKNLEDALEDANEVCKGLNTSKDLGELILRIEETRINLFKADSNLSDCHEILMGYSSVLKKIETGGDNEEI